MMTMLPELFKTTPAVFAAGEEYQIMIPVNGEALLWIEIGEYKYYDHSNGIMISDTDMHRVCVPQKVLNEARAYTVVYRKIIDRKPYYPESEDEVRTTFSFRPVKSFAETDTIRFYHLSDTHGRPEMPIEAAKYFGDALDFLIFNGDMIDHSGETKNFDVLFRIAEELTHGEIPIINSRGNHDMRGYCADRIKNYTPAVNGLTYYTVHLGDLYFILLDCAEDKDDASIEYGHTVACHAFRQAQTAYLKQIIADKKNTFDSSDIAHTFVLCHMPFTRIDRAPFNIEQDIYREWTRLLSDEVHPDLMIAGHMHKAGIYRPGDENDSYGQSFSVVIAGEPQRDRYIGGAFAVTKDQITVHLTDNEKNAAEIKL